MLIYDVEIKNAIPGKGERIPGIKYCGGWDDFEGMGIAVIGVYDYTEYAYRVFCEDNLKEFESLVRHHIDQGSVIIGFNSFHFDNPLCRAHGLNIPNDDSYDLLVEVWKAAGLGPDFKKETHMGYGLDDLIQANIPGYRKMGNGSEAPVLWQQGKFGAVIDYCLSDVWLTKMLIDLVWKRYLITNPNNGDQLTVERPKTGGYITCVGHRYND